MPLIKSNMRLTNAITKHEKETSSDHSLNQSGKLSGAGNGREMTADVGASPAKTW
jgi:hypothetical protein